MSQEQWVVAITRYEYIDVTSVIGLFESEEIAQQFGKIWNRRRDESIDKVIAEEPDADYDFPYVKAKAVNLVSMNICQEIMDEINSNLNRN